MILSAGRALELDPGLLADRHTQVANANYYPAGEWLQLAGLWTTYGELYRRQSWVGTVVRKLAFGTARLPFVVREQTDTGAAPVSVAESRFAEVMNRPNPNLDAFGLWLWTSSTYDVYGEAYWLKLRDADGGVRELWPMHPTQITVRRGADGGREYVFNIGGGRSTGGLPAFSAADVVPFKNYNPETVERGLSNLEGLRQTLLNEDAAGRATASWWNKGARPSIMLEHPRRLNDDVIRRLREQAESRHGGADNTGSTMVLEEGMKAQVVQLSAEEMQYIDSRKLNREEVCGAYDVPPPVVHILDHSTFSNITEQMRSMYRDTMGARLPLFESAIDHHLRPDFDPTGTVCGAFDLDGVLRGDFETRASAVTGLIDHGVMKPSEARPLFGLPDGGPAADRLYGNAALVPLGSNPRATPTTTLIQPAAASLVRRRYRAPRELGGALGTKTASEARRTLAEQHAAALRGLFARQARALAAALHQTRDPDRAFDVDAAAAQTVDTLEPLTDVTARTLGRAVAKQLGSTFNPALLADALHDNTVGAAVGICRSSAAQIAAALGAEDPAQALNAVFGDGRAEQIARTRVTSVGGLAEHAAASQAGSQHKTWVVTNPNPRAAHAAMDGETVGIDDVFSNGLAYPGDPDGEPDQTAGCTCALDFGTGGT